MRKGIGLSILEAHLSEMRPPILVGLENRCLIGVRHLHFHFEALHRFVLHVAANTRRWSNDIITLDMCDKLHSSLESGVCRNEVVFVIFELLCGRSPRNDGPQWLRTAVVPSIQVPTNGQQRRFGVEQALKEVGCDMLAGQEGGNDILNLKDDVEDM